MLKFFKAMKVGTTNPIVARLGVGMNEIIEQSHLPSPKKEAIKEICFEIMQSLILAEKAAKPLIEEIAAAEKIILSGGIKIQSNGAVIQLPPIYQLDDCKIFLKYAKNTLQLLAKAMGAIFDQTFDGPHFHKIRDYTNQKLGATHVVSKLLNDDQSWIKKIIDLRNEDEHPRSGKIFCVGFDVVGQVEGKVCVNGPMFYDGTLIRESLETFSHNLLTFTEEMIVESIHDYFNEPMTVYDIPEDQRDPECPRRFEFGLRPEIAAQLKFS